MLIWRSDISEITLSQMAQYASTVDAQLQLAILNLRIHTSRSASLTGLLMQAIIVVCCFSLLEIEWLTVNSFSPHSEISRETTTMRWKLSRIGRN
jgi:hypothetical protein